MKKPVKSGDEKTQKNELKKKNQKKRKKTRKKKIKKIKKGFEKTKKAIGKMKKMKIERIVIATANPHKASEIREILRLAGLGCKIGVLSSYPGMPKVEEDGATYEENARKKAVATAKFLGMPALAEDSGVEVGALGEKPGPKTARFVAEIAKERGIDYESDYSAACSAANGEILARLEGKKGGERAAKYVSAACLAFPDGKCVCARGECRGRVSESQRGKGGFGTDPIFCPKEFGYSRTFAELGQKAKNGISHRRRAIGKLCRKIREMKWRLPTQPQISYSGEGICK